MGKNLGLILLVGAGIWLWLSTRKVEAAPPIATPPVAPPAVTGLPAGFTASTKDMQAVVSAGYSKGSVQYEQAADLAYVKAASQVLPGETTIWTAEKGYFNMPTEEIISTYGWR